MAEHNELYQRAFYYDIAMRRDVSSELDFLGAVFGRHAGRSLASVLDVACGPGYHARGFARRGVRAVGLDLRPEMLGFAAELAAEDGVVVEWVTGDMRAFALREPVDMVFTMFDGLDALTENADLLAHFKAVSRNLTPGGIYLVDLSHPRHTGYEHYGDFRYRGERDGVRVEIIWGTNHPRYNLVTHVAHTELEIHIDDHGKQSVIHDSANERLLLPQEISLLAEMSGELRVAGWYGDYRLEQPLDTTPDSQRMIAILQRT